MQVNEGRDKKLPLQAYMDEQQESWNKTFSVVDVVFLLK